MSQPEPAIGQLAAIWESIAGLGAELSESDWSTPTDLPGWTVKDCVSHITGTELLVSGEPVPEVAVDHLPHVRDPFAAMMEAWVEERRDRSGADVLAEMVRVTNGRLEALGGLDESQWAEIGPSPIGEVPYRDFMAVRAFDCWMHEQDMRRAVGRPGHMSGPAVGAAVQRLGSALGYIVGKRAGAAPGTTVVLEITGEGGDTFAVEVRERAEALSEAPAEPTVRIRTDVETFCILGGGRRGAQECAGRVEIQGDDEIAGRILANMAVTP